MSFFYNIKLTYTDDKNLFDNFPSICEIKKIYNPFCSYII